VTLSSYKLTASIAVADMAEAREFYEGRLGLSVAEEQADGSRIYASAGGASLHVYPSPDHAGEAPATLATWYVSDLELVVADLSARGVTFERYDEAELKTDAKGIAATPDGKVAWFKDPDGNTFAIEERYSGSPAAG
jgi:catechol 2,3-dioxygenase-like lactoylglutathione lyase family enzyme